MTDHWRLQAATERWPVQRKSTTGASCFVGSGWSTVMSRWRPSGAVQLLTWLLRLVRETPVRDCRHWSPVYGRSRSAGAAPGIRRLRDCPNVILCTSGRRERPLFRRRLQSCRPSRAMSRDSTPQTTRRGIPRHRVSCVVCTTSLCRARNTLIIETNANVGGRLCARAKTGFYTRVATGNASVLCALQVRNC